MADSKVCTCCGIEKPFSEFTKDRTKATGIGWPCKACKNARNHVYNRTEKGRAIWALRERDRRADPAFIARERERNARHRAKGVFGPRDPFKEAARREMARAVKAGELIRPDRCQDCGKVCRVHGHHHDYSKALDVEWLCPTCHGDRHRKDVAPEFVAHYEEKWSKPLQAASGGEVGS